ncbi:MAG: type II secretion system protein GspD, partial [Kiritimatiellae bacterium]|nr:type II secretion system protein GspD [Kiritimatiellia bacterium]
LADQSGRNFTATPEAAGREISHLAWGETPDEVVEAICQTHRLWARRDAAGGVSLQTLDEFQADLESASPSEYSRVFPLMHPQAAEVASVIYGLYAGRVELYLGDEDILEDDLNDMGRRFDRFNMFAGGSSDVMNGFNPGTAGQGTGRRGGGNGGVYVFNGNGGWDEAGRDEGRLKGLDAKAAARAEAAKEAGVNEELDRVLAGAREKAPRIFVTLSRRNNLLFVRTSDPRVLEDIERVVERMDVPSPMVLLDVKVLEVSLGDSLDTVFDFTGKGKFHYDGPHEGTWDVTYPATSLLEKGLTFNWVTEDFLGRIQLLKEENKIKVMATPTLLTLNNEVSQLFMGRETPIVRNVTSRTVVTDNNVVTSPETEIDFVRVGTLLLLTPNINSNGTVTLRLLQENSDVSAEKAKIPIVNSSSGEIQYFDVDVVESRSVSGTFVAQDRQTVAIGGLVRERESDERSGIPVLMDIPLLGWLFRSTNKVKSRDELVILVTPYVIAAPEEGEAATKERAEKALELEAAREASGVEEPVRWKGRKGWR